MLTMTQVKRIRKLYYSKGKKVTEIAKITGRNHRTVVKYPEKDDFNKRVEDEKGYNSPRKAALRIDCSRR